MKVKQISTWEDFEAEVENVFSVVRAAKTENEHYVSSPLFRGQANDSWQLVTTLERFSPRPYAVNEYSQLLRAVEPSVLTLSPSAPRLGELEREENGIPMPPPGYEFMIYLRHHGFPSPLLDWTRSPYVAAFFAFQNARRDAENVAIYIFREYVEGGKGGQVGAPTIVGCGSYVAAHRRHHVQQCEYTICKKRDNSAWLYCSHEDAIEVSKGAQDVLVKYLISASERDKVLEKLDRMNVNAYSLFGNEESLMETLAYREIEKREKGRL
ncbi:MAG: FRG domain protein [Nitrospira sp.]|nr:MAG: FRG domain protein [Nitrospira sp.]